MIKPEEYGVKPLYLRIGSLFQKKQGYVTIPNYVSLTGLDGSKEEQ